MLEEIGDVSRINEYVAKAKDKNDPFRLMGFGHRVYKNYDPRAPRQHACGPRPHVWVTGPDPLVHKKYRAFIQHRNQSNYRNEPWDLTFDEYCDIWGELWWQRGREKDCYCLTRQDYSGAWTRSNVEVITRKEHNQRQIQHGRSRNGTPNKSSKL